MSAPLPSGAVLLLCRCFLLLFLLILFGTSSKTVSGANVTHAGKLDTQRSSPAPVKNLAQSDAGNFSSRTKLLSALVDGAGRRGSSTKANIQADGPSDVSTGPTVTAETLSRKKNSQSGVWYSTADWLPSSGIKPDRSVNLAVLPMLALFFFVFGVCVKCYSWVRDQDRTKARGQLDFEDADEVNYGIITAGEQGYREVDIRSDSTSMYDTVTSFRSFRLPFNEHTVTSVKSLPNQPYETFRSIVLQKADEGVYDSVQSYKAFLEKSISEVDIEVELVNDYTPRPRSKSYDQSLVTPSQEASRSKRRRLRHHSGGRGLEGGVKTQAERERFRRHSDKSSPHPPPPPPAAPDSIRSKTFHRRSSPAILEPLLQGTEFKIPLEQSDEEEEEGGEEGGRTHTLPHQSPLGRQSSNSSSSTSHSSEGSRPRSKESSHRQRREKLRQKRASQDRLAERAAKSSSHSSGHCSDDSAPSSSSCKGSSSNELDSESDVTDSGLVMDLQKPAKQSCFKNGTSMDTSRSGSPGDHEEAAKGLSCKVHRFKVSFVDDTTLSAASE